MVVLQGKYDHRLQRQVGHSQPQLELGPRVLLVAAAGARHLEVVLGRVVEERA